MPYFTATHPLAVTLFDARRFDYCRRLYIVFYYWFCSNCFETHAKFRCLIELLRLLHNSLFHNCHTQIENVSKKSTRQCFSKFFFARVLITCSYTPLQSSCPQLSLKVLFATSTVLKLYLLTWSSPFSYVITHDAPSVWLSHWHSFVMIMPILPILCSRAVEGSPVKILLFARARDHSTEGWKLA